MTRVHLPVALSNIMRFLDKKKGLVLNVLGIVLLLIPNFISVVFGLISALGGAFIAYKESDRLEFELDQVKPRNISPEKRATLVAKLSEKSGSSIGFMSRFMDGESADYCNKISLIFKEAGWHIAPAVRTSLNDLPNYLAIVVTEGQLNEHQLQNDVRFILSVFTQAGIDLRSETLPSGSIGGALQADMIYIVVGRKS